MGGGLSPEQAPPAVALGFLLMLSQHWSPACCHGRREFICASTLSCAKDATSAVAVTLHKFKPDKIPAQRGGSGLVSTPPPLKKLYVVDSFRVRENQFYSIE